MSWPCKGHSSLHHQLHRCLPEDEEELDPGTFSVVSSERELRAKQVSHPTLASPLSFLYLQLPSVIGGGGKIPIPVPDGLHKCWVSAGSGQAPCQPLV